MKSENLHDLRVNVKTKCLESFLLIMCWEQQLSSLLPLFILILKKKKKEECEIKKMWSYLNWGISIDTMMSC